MEPFDQLSDSRKKTVLLALAEKSLGAWKLQGNLSLIKQRENAVYALTTTEGQRFALRVHRAGYHSDAALNSEVSWCDALRQAGMSVPQTIKTASGENFVSVSVDGIDAPRQVDLLAWIEGDQVGSVEEGLGDDAAKIRDIYLTLGELAGQVHNQSSGWTVPDGFERHAWNSEGLLGEQPLWGRFWQLGALSAEQGSLMLQAREAMTADLNAMSMSPDHYSMIHADLVPENILVDGDKIQIIDFDDAGFGWHLFELATVLYFIQGDENYPIARDALIEGYRSKRALSDESLAQLPLFLAARSTTYLGWVHTRENTETAIELTPMLIEMSCAAVTDYLQSRSSQ